MNIVSIKEDFTFSLRHPRVRVSIIGFALSVLLALIVGMAYWWPVMHDVNRLKAEINVRRQSIADAEYSSKLAQSSDDAARQITLIDKKLDTSVTQAGLVQSIASLARRHNVKILSEAYEEGKAKDGYAPLVHELSVQAGYAELRDFIAGVQQLPTFTIVQEATLARSSKSSAIRAQLHIITYRRAVEDQT